MKPVRWISAVSVLLGLSLVPALISLLAAGTGCATGSDADPGTAAGNAAPPWGIFPTGGPTPLCSTPAGSAVPGFLDDSCCSPPGVLKVPLPPGCEPPSQTADPP